MTHFAGGIDVVASSLLVFIEAEILDDIVGPVELVDSANVDDSAVFDVTVDETLEDVAVEVADVTVERVELVVSLSVDDSAVFDVTVDETPEDVAVEVADVTVEPVELVDSLTVKVVEEAAVPVTGMIVIDHVVASPVPRMSLCTSTR
jgi:hypothetical protein